MSPKPQGVNQPPTSPPPQQYLTLVPTGQLLQPGTAQFENMAALLNVPVLPNLQENANIVQQDITVTLNRTTVTPNSLFEEDVVYTAKRTRHNKSAHF